MAKPLNNEYIEARNFTEQVMPIVPRATVAGTAASATEIGRITAFSNIRALEAQILVHTGGTAAGGPVITINTSLAGTGASSPIGTATFGTNANNTVIDVTLTETSISVGDDIVIEIAAGTNASSPVVTPVLGYVEEFVGS